MTAILSRGDELMLLIHFCCTTGLMYHIPKWYIAFDRSRCSTKSPPFPCYCHRSKYIAANMLSYSKHRLRTYQPHCGPSNCRPICQSCVETDAKKRRSASIIGGTETAEMLYAIYIMWHILNIKPHRNAITEFSLINTSRNFIHPFYAIMRIVLRKQFCFNTHTAYRGHITACAKWSPCCRRHFQRHLVERKITWLDNDNYWFIKSKRISILRIGSNNVARATDTHYRYAVCSYINNSNRYTYDTVYFTSQCIYLSVYCHKEWKICLFEKLYSVMFMMELVLSYPLGCFYLTRDIFKLMFIYFSLSYVFMYLDTGHCGGTHHFEWIYFIRGQGPISVWNAH